MSSSQTEASAGIRDASAGVLCEETCVSDGQTATVEETETADRTFISKNSCRGIVFKSEHETFFSRHRPHAGTRRGHAPARKRADARARPRGLARGRQHLAKLRIVSVGRIGSSEKDRE